MKRVWTGAALALVLAAGPGLAQTIPAATPPVPAESAPPAQSPAPPPGASPGLPTLIPQAGDPSDVDEVVMPAKPVLIVSGTSGWDGGLKTLRAAFARITAELAREGMAPAGRPLALFVETTDDTFKFDAMVPVATAPASPPTLPTGMRFGLTPSGKAWRFVHKGPYDDIDTTYETVTTYLDAKDISAKDAFLEEYLNDVADPGDANLEINIFVQPR